MAPKRLVFVKGSGACSLDIVLFKALLLSHSSKLKSQYLNTICGAAEHWQFVDVGRSLARFLNRENEI